MSLKKLGPRVTFLAVLGAAVALSPFGCAAKLPAPSAGPASTAEGASPTALVEPPSLLSLLPHPAFAFAKANDEAVSIADIAEKAAPSVVNVSPSRTVRGASSKSPFFEDPMFRRFFGPGSPGGHGGPGRQRDHQERGLGSGVIVSKDGIVLTNNHVVEHADEIKVTTADKREFDAKVVGRDAKSDLAVLQLEGDTTGLAPIALGNSSRMRLGDVVLAIGNPFGVGQTITMGIVSAKGRANVGIVDYEDFIQTDAAINPGNSGGALINMEGELIGINTAILSRSGGYMGIGFAIPTNMAQPIMESLIDGGRVVRGWLGVGIQDVDRELAQALALPTTTGVLVSEVMKGSPAEKAGLARGDVVVELDGKKTDSTGRLRNLVAASGARSKVTLSLLREAKPKTLTVTLGELPDESAAGASKPGKAKSGALDGLTLENLASGHRDRFKIGESVDKGAVIVDIDPGSPAAKSGLRPGDVVLEVNRRVVADVGGFQRAYKAGKGRLLLLVHRRGRSVYVVLKR